MISPYTGPTINTACLMTAASTRPICRYVLYNTLILNIITFSALLLNTNCPYMSFYLVLDQDNTPPCGDEFDRDFSLQMKQ